MILNIYALINNAGIANTKLLHEETYSDLTKIIDTNLLGSINVSNALIPNMIKNKNGKLLTLLPLLVIDLYHLLEHILQLKLP